MSRRSRRPCRRLVRSGDGRRQRTILREGSACDPVDQQATAASARRNSVRLLRTKTKKAEHAKTTASAQQVRGQNSGGGVRAAPGSRSSYLPWAGFAPLRKGRIHVFCPRCHRKVSNALRGEYDPPRATLVHTFCDRCGAGGKDSPESFYAANGQEISWDVIERHIKRVIDSRRDTERTE